MSDIPIININLKKKEKLEDLTDQQDQKYPSEFTPGKLLNKKKEETSFITAQNKTPDIPLQRSNLIPNPPPPPPPPQPNNNNNNNPRLFVRTNPILNQNNNTSPDSYLNNYKKMSKKFKIQFFIALIICFSISFITSTLIFVKVMLPRMVDKKFKFFCAAGSLFDIDELCFLAFGQLSFGIIAIGQISIGVITIGQVSVGFIVILGQVSCSFVFTYLSQITVSMICYANQIGICGLFCYKSLICSSPLNPIIKGKGNFFTTDCK